MYSGGQMKVRKYVRDELLYCSIFLLTLITICTFISFLLTLITICTFVFFY